MFLECKKFLINLFEKQLDLMCSFLNSSNGLGIWFPEIINKMSTNKSTDPLKLCQILELQKSVLFNSAHLECDDSINVQVFTSNLILGGFYVVGYVVIALVIKYGRGFVFGIYSQKI